MFSDKTKWIGRGREKQPPVCPCRLQARREFKLRRAFKRARLLISARQLYKLYINGDYVCQGPALADGEAAAVDEVDVTSLLRQGQNLIALDLYDPKGEPGCALELFLDGVSVLVSDRHFGVASPEGVDMAMDGAETVDASLLQRGRLTQQGFGGVSAAPRVQKLTLSFAPAAPAVPWKSILPESGEDGLYELSVQRAGEVTLSARGSADARIFLYPLAADLAPSEKPRYILKPGASPEPVSFYLPSRFDRLRVQVEGDAEITELRVRAHLRSIGKTQTLLVTAHAPLLTAFERWRTALLEVNEMGLDEAAARRSPLYQAALCLLLSSPDALDPRRAPRSLSLQGSAAPEKASEILSVGAALARAISDPGDAAQARFAELADLAKQGKIDELYQAVLDESCPAEAAACAFVRYLLGIDPDAPSLERWSDPLPAGIPQLRFELTSGARRIVYERAGGISTLSAVAL